MKIEKLDPQLRKMFGRIPPIPFHNPVALALLKILGLIPRKITAVPGVTITQQQIAGGRVRIYRPDSGRSGAGMLWIHGGGYLIGDAATNDRECIMYAELMKLVVVSVDYRLAPKHPFPAAIDDCFTAWLWMQENATELGISADRIVISGQSAGGGLAAALAQRVLDHGGVQPAGQSLIYPMLDDRTATRHELDAIKHRIWNNRNNRGGWTYYLGQAPGQRELPDYAAPARRIDLAGLPPTWVGVGEIDLFYEEDVDYARRLQEAGVECELYTVPGAPHAFEMLVPAATVSREFVESNNQFLRRVLAL